MTIERIDADTVCSVEGRGHVTRYRLAAGFVRSGDRVLDAACGIGYGADLLAPPSSGVQYIGVDREPVVDQQHRPGVTFGVRDLTEWDMASDPWLVSLRARFDVGVSFETIEHLDDYSLLLKNLKLARRWIICSVPVVPTVHENPWHRHDFEPGQLVGLIADECWDHYQTLGQPSELSEIYVFRRTYR